MCKALSTRLAQLAPTDPYRIETTEAFLHKLYNMGLVPTQKRCVCPRYPAWLASSWFLYLPVFQPG
jgi:hypothetical protein